ncbi:MAG TPA: COX15/CtaA family protein [Bryobacteraceae bacterium]|nr:COX15/CtaA family protein [Bryobacteraceae bacterium]
MQPSTTASRRFARYAWGVVALNVAVVLWGALVRATGSGAGCGNNWPRCNGEVIPTSPTLHTLIEFTHRAMTGADLPMVGLLVFWAFRLFPRRHPVRATAVLSAVFLVTEALIGAGLVLFDQVAQNASPSRAWWLSGHLLNTLTLLGVLTLTAWWGAGYRPARFTGRPALAAGVSLVAVALLGISGAITALGDTLYPSASLSAGLAQDFSPMANFWLRLRLFHPMIAAAVAVWLGYYALSNMARHLELRPRAVVLLGLVALQLAAGAANLLLLAPLWMQILHLLLADLIWISLVILCAEAASAAPLTAGHAPSPAGPLGVPGAAVTGT